jgi:hypothetical protein
MAASAPIASESNEAQAEVFNRKLISRLLPAKRRRSATAAAMSTIVVQPTKFLGRTATTSGHTK